MTNATSSTQMSPELKKRIVTAVIGVTVLLLLIFFAGTFGVGLIAAVVAVGMMWEYADMTLALPDKAEKRIGLAGLTWLIAFFNFLVPRSEYAILLVAFLGLFAYFLFTAGRYSGAEFARHFHELTYSFFGLLYLAFLPLFLVSIRDSGNGLHWLMIFLLIVWAGDTGAYFAGKRFGRRKLYPEISPKKTVEGSIGGLVLGVLVCLLYRALLFRGLTWSGAVLIPLIVGAAAQVGDLCESFLKRAFDRKDSGTILPGHGGILDRFDSVVFAVPIMYGCMRILS